MCRRSGSIRSYELFGVDLWAINGFVFLKGLRRLLQDMYRTIFLIFFLIYKPFTGYHSIHYKDTAKRSCPSKASDCIKTAVVREATKRY